MATNRVADSSYASEMEQERKDSEARFGPTPADVTRGEDIFLDRWSEDLRFADDSGNVDRHMAFRATAEAHRTRNVPAQDRGRAILRDRVFKSRQGHDVE